MKKMKKMAMRRRPSLKKRPTFPGFNDGSRNGPLVELVSLLEEFSVRLERPCNVSVMKKNLKALLLDGTYFTSYQVRIKKIEDLGDLKRFVSQLIQTFNLMSIS